MQGVEKQDFFSVIPRLGIAAARVDWLNHVQGGHLFLGGAESPLQPTGCYADSIRSQDDINLRKLVIEDEETGILMACEPDFPGEAEAVGRKEIDLYELDVGRFAEWLKGVLKLPRKLGYVLLAEGRLIQYKLTAGNVYYSFSTDARELKCHLSVIDEGVGAILLLPSDWWTNSPSALSVLSIRSLIQPITIQDCVAYQGGTYTYHGISPLTGLLANRAGKLVKPASFLPPPPCGCTWENLRLVIKTPGHYEMLDIQKDVLIAWYEDMDGRMLCKPAFELVRKLPKLTRAGRATDLYIMLKTYACSGGAAIGLCGKNQNVDNVNRKKLRSLLCAMFGRPESDNPIVSVRGNNGPFECLFKIGFSDANSDPLSETRSKGRVEFSTSFANWAQVQQIIHHQYA